MRLLSAFILVVFALISSAQAGPALSKQDKQILSQLSPQTRQEVISRLTPGETVKGILETMVLNRLSALYAEGRVVGVDVIQGTAVIQYPDGTQKTEHFNIEEIIIRS